jgi:hypothetical protein
MNNGIGNKEENQQPDKHEERNRLSSDPREPGASAIGAMTGKIGDQCNIPERLQFSRHRDVPMACETFVNRPASATFIRLCSAARNIGAPSAFGLVLTTYLGGIVVVSLN